MALIKENDMTVLRRCFAQISILIFCAGVMPVMAQEPERVDRILDAWAEWLESNDVEKSTIAITYGGQDVTRKGMNIDANAPLPVASLSKAITAVCAQELIDQGKLSPDMTLGGIFADDVSMLGKIHKENQGITVLELISHSSGLRRDSTQASMMKWVGDPKVRHLDVARSALQAKRRKVGQYRYNNENYAILGAVIAHVSGETYGDYCQHKVLSPAGVKSARLSNTWGGFAAWGGWDISAADYARFVAFHFGPNSKIAQKPTDFMHIDLGQGVYYGLGTYFRQGPKYRNFWHAGRLCFKGANGGSYFAHWRGGWGVVVLYDACVDDPAIGVLDGVLSRAALR
jgi:CubicO group peptidase (beta-lactamase class C family)